MSEFSFFKTVEQRDVTADLGDNAQHFRPLLAELQRVIGMANTLKLVEHWGGVNLYVPAAMPRNHRIARVIGEEAAELLSRHFGLERIIVPLAHSYKTALRDAEIYRQHKAGEPAPALARKHGLTVRSVWKILKRVNFRIVKSKYKNLMGSA